MPDALVNPAQASRTFDQVISQLRDLIHSGRLSIGDRLPPERTLADQFEVSRNMVREALRMLEITGMIELRPGRYGGAFVCAGRPEIVTRSLSDMMSLAAFSLADLTEARMWLSAAVIRAVNERATSEDLVVLQRSVDAAAERALAGDWASVAQINMHFHELLAEMTRNPVLIMVHASIMGVIRQISFHLGPMTTDKTVKHRQKIMKCLRARDGDGAAAEMTRNLRSVHAIWMTKIGDDNIGSVFRHPGWSMVGPWER